VAVEEAFRHEASCDKIPGCTEWRNIKTLLGHIYNAELADIMNDAASLLAGVIALTPACVGSGVAERWAKKASRPMLIMMSVGFVVDLSLEIFVATQAGSASSSIATFSNSDCFSRGDGAATMVRVADAADGILTMTILNAVIAVIGFCTDMFGLWQEDQNKLEGKTGIDVFNWLTVSMAVLELGIGLFDFFQNTGSLIGEIESIEHAVALHEPLERGHVCITRNENLEPLAKIPGVEKNMVLAIVPVLSFQLAMFLLISIWIYKSLP